MNPKLIFINIILAICFTKLSYGQSKTNVSETSSTLQQVCEFYPGNYNPITILEVANELSVLPKKEIIYTVRKTYESFQGTSDGYGLCLLLQLTFDIPDSLGYPELIWGIPIGPEPEKSELKNRFLF